MWKDTAGWLVGCAGRLACCAKFWKKVICYASALHTLLVDFPTHGRGKIWTASTPESVHALGPLCKHTTFRDSNSTTIMTFTNGPIFGKHSNLGSLLSSYCSKALRLLKFVAGQWWNGGTNPFLIHNEWRRWSAYGKWMFYLVVIAGDCSVTSTNNFDALLCRR